MTDNREHSPLGASSAERWLNCPKSYSLIQKLGASDEGSEHANLGTAAHKLAEMCLDSGQDAWEYIGQEVDGFTVGTGDNPSEINCNSVQVYLDYVRPLAENADHAEWEVRLGDKWKPHRLYMGTADFVAVFDNAIEVVDYKNGAGIIVAPDSAQLKYYAIGAFAEAANHLPETAEVRMTIVQPNAPGNPIRTHIITVYELVHWSNSVLVPGMLKAEKGDGDYVTGDWCRFCPAILDCPKQQEDLKALNQAEIDRISDDELDLLYPTFGTVKMFMRAAEARLQARLQEGASFQTCKLVAKRSPGRVWKEGVEELLVQTLGDDAYEKTLVSPAKAEKLSKKMKDFVAENAFLQPSTGYNLVPVSDSAPEAKPAADIQSVFGHYTV
jgi:hypothetical protein